MFEIVFSGVVDKCNLYLLNFSFLRFFFFIRVFGRENILNIGVGNEVI